jgi:hypothetical protein
MADIDFCAKMEFRLTPIGGEGRLLQLVFNYGVTPSV